MRAGRASPASLAATGGVGGLFSGLTGVGGGAVMVPLMTGVLKMSQHTAHGTSLLVIIFAALAGALTYLVNGSAEWALVATLLAGSAIGAYAGARLVQLLPALRLRQLFGVFLLALGARLLVFHDTSAMLSTSGLAEHALGAAIGLAGGLSSGALGVGGGAIFVPGLVILLGTGQHEAQAASLNVIVVTAMVGAFTHYRHGTADPGSAAWIIPAAVPAGVGGAMLADQLDAGVLQRIFALVLVGVGTQMLVSATRALRRPAAAHGVVLEVGR
ncbi:sulfite exporter TauE/SafE family protein [bacterium]|nr:MAG: sulfite exporter TauE/SafE family protein [bacterium]MCL4231031.1 sulfite exporter TauE/SafE family protein [Dehalococcoidia bacterium]